VIFQRSFKERLISRLFFYFGVMLFLFIVNQLQSKDRERLIDPSPAALSQSVADNE